MELTELTISGFRNLESRTIELGPRTNLLLGRNGAGKTSLLEAIVVLGNLRSFRTTSLRQAARHGERVFHLGGGVSDGFSTRRLEQVVEVGPPLRRQLLLDGGEVRTEQYLQVFPVFAITGPDRELVGGGPEGRRALLDRFVFLLEAPFLDALRNYRRALRQRNAALVGGAKDAEIEAWEDRLAVAAARIVVGRQRGVTVLSKRFSEVCGEIGEKCLPDVEIRYRGESWCGPEDPQEKVEDLYRQRYNETRTRDRQAGFTGDGPHRHDLSLRTAGRAIRYVLSSGQSKMVAAALRLATLAQVEKERGERFPVIVDDVDAELDGAAAGRLLSFLGGERQLFLSSTNEALTVQEGSNLLRLWIENGEFECREAESDD